MIMDINEDRLDIEKAFSNFTQVRYFDTAHEPMVIPYTGTTYTNLRDITGRAGLEKGSLTVIGVASGGGKTTLCSQLMVDAAFQKRHSLYVSTEMDASNMRARFLSYASWKLTLNWLIENGRRVRVSNGVPLPMHELPDACPYEPVPYRLLNGDALCETHWTDSAVAEPASERTPRMLYTLREVHDRLLCPYMHFVYQHNIGNEWDAYMEEAARRLNGAHIELVCYDWLGGDMDEINDARFDMRKALAYRASTLADMAARYNMAVVTTVQLNSDSDGEFYPSISTFSECKSVKNRARIALAISSMDVDDTKAACKRTKNKLELPKGIDILEDGHSGKSSVQGMTCGKSRNGRTGRYLVFRNFDYQCYVRF